MFVRSSDVAPQFPVSVPPRSSSLGPDVLLADEVVEIVRAHRVPLVAATARRQSLPASVSPSSQPSQIAAPQPNAGSELLRFQLATTAGDQLLLANPAQPQAAAAKWQAAMDCDVARAGYNWLAVRSALSQPGTQRGLLQMHLACHAPDVVTARAHFAQALQDEPQVSVGMDALAHQLRSLVPGPLAAATPADSVPLQRYRVCRDLFLPMYGPSKAGQQLLIAQLQQARYAAAHHTATLLAEHWPHLLAPHAAKFVCEVERDTRWVAGQAQPEIERSVVKAWHMGKLMGWVSEWDAAEHHGAQGGLTVQQHRYVWSLFLDACNRVEPILYGARFDGDELVQPRREDRVYMGMVRADAVALPLHTKWFTRVAELNAAQSRTSAAETRAAAA